MTSYPGWQEIVDTYSTEYERVNGVPCPWGDKRAFSTLRTLVTRNTGWTKDMWLRCIVNMFASEDINPAAPPHLNIPKLPGYVHGPLNRFHQVMRATYNPAREGVSVDSEVHPLSEQERAELRRMEQKLASRHG